LKNLDDLKMKNKPLFIDKNYDYFQTIFIFLNGCVVANTSGAVSAVVATVGSLCCYWYSSFRNSNLTILEKLG
jgi:hypothetical protein